jgi:hypothetical protein
MAIPSRVAENPPPRPPVAGQLRGHEDPARVERGAGAAGRALQRRRLCTQSGARRSLRSVRRLLSEASSNACSRPADASFDMRGTSCSNWPKVT